MIFGFKKRGITNNASSGGVLQNADNTLGIFIDMPAVFGGRITFSHPTCAYMEPLDTAIYDDGSCHLSIKNSFGDPVPVDSTDIFIYKSGSLNISFSNCVIKTERNPITGETNQFQECIASGTFDLTLVNRNNEIIKITNGIVSFHVIR